MGECVGGSIVHPTEFNLRRYEFPSTLDLRPYTQEYMHDFDTAAADAESPAILSVNRSKSIARSESRLQRRISRSNTPTLAAPGADGPAESSGAAAATSVDDAATNACYEYELVGIVAHTGSMSSGHYYSFIKDKRDGDGDNEQWFEYNDEHVSPYVCVCVCGAMARVLYRVPQPSVQWSLLTVLFGFARVG